MSKKQGYLVCIKPDGTETREPFKGREAPYERLRALVGGIITSVKVKPEDGSVARVGFVHDEGLLIGLAYNARASRMYMNAYPQARKHPAFNPDHFYLVGPLVYTEWRQKEAN